MFFDDDDDDSVGEFKRLLKTVLFCSGTTALCAIF